MIWTLLFSDHGRRFTGLTSSSDILQSLTFCLVKTEQDVSVWYILLCRPAQLYNFSLFFLPPRAAFELPNLCQHPHYQSVLIHAEGVAEESQSPFPDAIRFPSHLLCTSWFFISFNAFFMGSMSFSLFLHSACPFNRILQSDVLVLQTKTPRSQVSFISLLQML